MIDKSLLFGILFGLASLYLAIGVWASQKVKSIKSYFLADRNLGVFKLTFTLIATQLGSGLLLGTAQRAYSMGLSSLFYTFGISLGFILLGCGFASRMRALNIGTTAEIFEVNYNSLNLKYVASALSIISLWGILVAQIYASKALFLSLGLDDPYILTTFWLFLIFYTMLGGLGSVVIIDAIQVTFIFSIFSYLFIKAAPMAGSLQNLIASQTIYFPQHISIQNLLPTLMIPTLFSLIEQDLAQRFFSAKTKSTATISALLASVILIAFSCIPLFFGMIAKLQGIIIPTGGDPLMATVATIAGKSVFVLAICGIIAAITSTADSLLSAISSNIIQDFGTFLPMDKQKLFISRLVSFITGITALIASYCITGDIISILENSYRISVICLLFPTVIAYFYKNLSATAAWGSMIAGIAGFIYAKTFIISPIFKDLVPLGCSLIAYLTVHFFTQKK